jgi:ribosome-binding ATPase YchF (GTP1/OBG family)
VHVSICGYRGSGKSTVFTALAPGAGGERAGVTLGRIQVPDERVERLAAHFSPRKKTLAEIVFADVAGKGRSDAGAFPPEVVQAMRNADVLAHVVGVFDVLPEEAVALAERDSRRLADELVLLDLVVIERRHERWRKEGKVGLDVEVNDRALAWLEAGKPLRELSLRPEELAGFEGVQLLSLRPLITLLNLSEEQWQDPLCQSLRRTVRIGEHEHAMAICGALEAEIATFEDQAEFLAALGLGEPARNAFVRTAHAMLDLISFLTAGPDECRAWPIHRGTRARRAAGRVHSDIERGFIRVEVYRVEDLEAYGSEVALKAAGRMRLEGKEYVVADGDVCNFRFNV